MASRASRVIDLESGVCVQSPPSPTLQRARPRAPNPFTNSSSLSASVRLSEVASLAGMRSALMMPFASSACANSGTPPPFIGERIDVRSVRCRSKRRSGLSTP